MSSTSQRIAAFWALFTRHHAQLAVAESADDPVYDHLLEGLHEVDQRLFLEFSNTEAPCELIITAEGEREAFDIARAVAGSAPTLQGWTVQALKPKLGFPATVDWQGFVLDLSKVWFIPLPQTDGLGLRLLVSDVQDADLEDAHNAVLRALDHGLGEERHAETILFTEIVSLPTGHPPPNAIPLAQLEDYIERHGSGIEGAG